MSSQVTLAKFQITPTQQLRITGSIQTEHNREALGVDIRKWYLKDGDYHPTQKGIWLSLVQLRQLMLYLLTDSLWMTEVARVDLTLLSGTPPAEPRNFDAYAAVDQFLNPELLQFLRPPQEGEGIERLS